MKFVIVLLLIFVVLWGISLARKGRRGTNGDNGSTGGPDVTGNDYSSSRCGNDDSGCDGGGDGGGD